MKLVRAINLVRHKNKRLMKLSTIFVNFIKSSVSDMGNKNIDKD